ncbi:MAG TPA: GNAT family protein [Candidatus Limnocylindrales bacterium]|jgi:RimJ/RimL family protein N-acetyltransferase|nr:GNAT family protein [Candidatus Limnocylindrales bacterium]
MDAVDDPDRRLDAVWPLFGLRIRSERLVLRLPRDDDLVPLLDVARAGIHPPDEMPFGIAWTDATGPEFVRSFLQHHWRWRGIWRPQEWWLNLMVEWDGRPIGAQTISGDDFAVHRIVDSGSWLGQAYQGRGFGKEMRSAILSFSFDGLAARAATSSAFLDNAASNAVSRSLGYAEDGRGALAPRGVSRETQRFRMTVEDWRSRPRPSVDIEGLDPCRDMFGA